MVRIETYAQNIVDTVRVPLLILDASLRVRSANRAYYHTFHVRPEQTEKFLIYELGNGQWDIPKLRDLLEDIILKSSVFDDFELDHTFPEIGRRVMLLNARRLHAGQHGEMIVLAMDDVTARRRVEEVVARAKDAAESSNHAKSAFLANMSHEIRTPMNGVLGMTDLLLGTPLNDLQRSYARTIHSSGEALLTVINDILDFSKIEAGRLTLELAEFDLRELMEEVADLLAPGAIRKGLKIGCRVARKVPRRMVGDPVRIRQILTNLAGNAVKFTERGEVDLEAILIVEDADNVTLQIQVRDTGVGIAEGRHGDIFESFTQIEGGTSRQHGGTGLGLTICQSLVRLMGGRIGVESRIGSGSIFWFQASFARVPGEENSLNDALDGLHVLIVDNIVANGKSLRETLASWGCRPEVVGSGIEALGRILAGPDDPYGLILLDRDIPDLDGDQISRVIRSAPHYGNVPIVFLAESMPPEAVATDGNPSAAWVAKPFRRSQLYNALCRSVAAPGRDLAHQESCVEENPKLSLPLHVLLVEDNDVNREVAIGMLERIGCEVEAVWNGREALEVLDYERHDLILMDVQMPEMDGFAATEAIRELEKGTDRHVPIIALTAHAMQGDRDRCVAVGMDDYLTKPIRPRPLIEAMIAWGGKGEGSQAEATSPRMPVGDPSFVEGLGVSCGGDTHLIRRVLELMLNGVPPRLERLGAAIGARDVDQASGEVHSLKGAFATVGDGDLAADCMDLMSYVKKGDHAAIERSFRQVRVRWESLEGRLNLYLGTLRH